MGKHKNVNKPCPCGSGKKYKKCCISRPLPPPEVLEAARRFDRPPFDPFMQAGYLTGRQTINTTHEGKRYRAVGNRVYTRPLNEPFHQFILDIFNREVLGMEWLTKERTKQNSERHPLSLWYEEVVNDIQSVTSKDRSKNLFRVQQSGNVRLLLATAYDYYSVLHCNAPLQPNFLKRLNSKTSFQGARYELAIAGIAVRAGFNITWNNSKGKHCEFIGVHRSTGEKVAFEAKSHHRAGVLGNAGEPFNPESARTKIMDHVREAIEQNTEKLPLVIFDDINLPLTPGIDFEDKKWVSEVDDALKAFGFMDGTKTETYGALILTNFAWYFYDSVSHLKENEVISYFYVNNHNPIMPETISLLNGAAKQYGFVPPNLEEFDAEEFKDVSEPKQ